MYNIKSYLCTLLNIIFINTIEKNYLNSKKILFNNIDKFYEKTNK